MTTRVITVMTLKIILEIELFTTTSSFVSSLRVRVRENHQHHQPHGQVDFYRLAPLTVPSTITESKLQQETDQGPQAQIANWKGPDCLLPSISSTRYITSLSPLLKPATPHEQVDLNSPLLFGPILPPNGYTPSPKFTTPVNLVAARKPLLQKPDSPPSPQADP